MLRIAVALCLIASSVHAEDCIASRYSTRDHDQNGTNTASGIRLNDAIPTVAHKTAPLRSFLRITNLDNGRTMTFQNTDRGPYVAGRCIDFSMKAAELMDCSKCRVKVEPWIGW